MAGVWERKSPRGWFRTATKLQPKCDAVRMFLLYEHDIMLPEACQVPDTAVVMDSVNEVEKRPCKLRRSCEQCRASKARCCPGKDSGVCEKCTKEGRLCETLPAKPRPKRSKNSRTRVAEMEERLDSLMSLLATKTTVDPVKTSLVPSTNNFDELSLFNLEPLPSCNTLSVPKNQQFPVFSLPFSRFEFDDFEDVISKGLVSLEDAEISLQFFRTRASTFPFVVVPATTSVDILRREKPFLLLTIIMLGAQRDLKLQGVLEKETRELLSKKVIVNGEKSMDILQGLLIYLAWYHYYFEPEREQTYQLSQMITIMAIDMNLHRGAVTPATVTDEIICRQPTSEDIEKKRAFLGSYFLSSGISLGLRKPNSLKHNHFIEECSQMLVDFGDSETDYLLPWFIRLSQFAEDVNHAFDYDTNFCCQDTTKIEIIAKNFRQQLNQMALSFPPAVWSNPKIVSTYHYLRIYMNEIGFHATVPAPYELLSSQRPWYYSPARNDILVDLLQASKDYLDHVLSLSAQDFMDYNMLDFLHLIYGVLILGRFTTGCDAPCLDTEHIKTMSNLPHYVDALISKTSNFLTFVGEELIYNFVWKLNLLFKGCRKWYDLIISDPILGENLKDNMSFLFVLETAVGRCITGNFEENIAIQERNSCGWMDMVKHEWMIRDCT